MVFVTGLGYCNCVDEQTPPGSLPDTKRLLLLGVNLAIVCLTMRFKVLVTNTTSSLSIISFYTSYAGKIADTSHTCFYSQNYFTQPSREVLITCCCNTVCFSLIDQFQQVGC